MASEAVGGGDAVSVERRRTDHGFVFGAADVVCLCADERNGWVLISVKTPKNEIQVYVTKTGKIRIHGPDGREWTQEVTP